MTDNLLTAGELKKFLESVPNNALITGLYDAGWGRVEGIDASYDAENNDLFLEA